jgi:hypothetical protein
MGANVHDCILKQKSVEWVNSRRRTVRITIEISEKLVRETNREAIEKALRLMVRLDRQSDIRKFRGKVKWEGNLDELRCSRVREEPLSKMKPKESLLEFFANSPLRASGIDLESLRRKARETKSEGS